MNFYHRPRRLLLPSDDGGSGGAAASFDSSRNNMIEWIIVAAMFCVLICLRIHWMIEFLLRCVRRVGTGGEGETAQRFGCGEGLEKGLLSQIPVAVYGSGNGVAFTECPICLAEFSDGEKIRVLPKCHHCFHVRCVDIWLASHTSCPTCRRSLVEKRRLSFPAGGIS